MFAHLCITLDLPLKPTDPRFATNAARCDNHAPLKRLIEAITLGETVAHWIAKLEAAGLPTARVQDMGQVLQDPQLLARAMVLPIQATAEQPHMTSAGNPIKMSNLSEMTTRAPAPKLDADRRAILNWLNT